MPEFSSDTIQLHIAAYDELLSSYKFLCLKRSDSLIVYPSVWQVVTGRIEKGETALEAALREMKEETGLTVQKLWALPYVANYYNYKRDTINSSPVFGASVNIGDKVKLSEEHQAYDWLNYKDCVRKLQLPSHKEGTAIFLNNVLLADNNSIFEIKLD